MEATMLDPVEREQPSAPINNRFLMLDFKVKPCQLRRRCKGPDNCVYLHPGEKGRRDPLQSCYDLIPCASYRQNGGSCPHGDGCRRAHGVLELRFHPSAYLYAIRFKFKDLEAYLTGTKLLPAERAAIQLILNLKSNGCIHGYESPNDTKGAIYEETSSNIERVRAHLAGKAIVKKYGYAKDLSLKNNNGQLGSSSGGSCELRAEEDGVAVTSIDEWEEPTWVAQLLSDVDASPMAGGIIVPNVEPDFFLDSGASTHVVGVEVTLHNYSCFPEPLSVIVADGYALRVRGIGSIISPCGNFVVPMVYRVEGIQMNLISVGQLDDFGFSSNFGDGRCEVKDHEDRVGGGDMQADRLYKLRFLQVPETRRS